ncbi:TPA: ribonuclease H, partial [Escherichia coli]|nr:ribonuclease H [Escherichia coli]
YSSLEDFFEPKVLQMKYNGKSFDKSNNHDSSTTFGKDRFATYIVRENRKTIDFSLFKPILDSIIEIKKHFINLHPSK